MPEISCTVLSFVCCCLVCHCLEKFQFQPRSIRFDFKFNVCNGWIFQDQKVGGSSPVRSELHYISSRTLTLGITNNCKYFIHLFIFHVTFSSSRFWVHENSVVFIWWPIMPKENLTQMLIFLVVISRQWHSRTKMSQVGQTRPLGQIPLVRPKKI